MKHTKLDLRKILDELDETIEQHENVCMDDVVTSNLEWQFDDIVYYLRTEQDPYRLARWCKLYLNQEY